MISNTSYCMLLGISLLLTPDVHGSDNWPKDRRFKNSRRASDEFELFRNQHYHRGYHHQHHKLYSDGYLIVNTSANKSTIPGEEFLVTNSAHSPGPTEQFIQQRLSELRNKNKLKVNNTLTPPSLPTPSRLISSVDLTDNANSSDDGARKRESTENSYEEDDRRILFASKVTSNVNKGPSYESSATGSSIGQGVVTSSISGYAFDKGKYGLGGGAKNHLKPAITKISLSLGGSSGSGNTNNKNNVDFTTASGQSIDLSTNHHKANENKKVSFGGIVEQSNEVKLNSLVAGSIGLEEDSNESNSFGSLSNNNKLNKASIMSSALNVIGGNDGNTQLAHSILVVQRPKSRPKPANSVNNAFFWDNTMLTDDSGPSHSDFLSSSLSSSSSSPPTTTTVTSTTTTSSTPSTEVPLAVSLSSSETFNSNHRPLGKPNKTRPWLRPVGTNKRKKPSQEPVSLVTKINAHDLSMMPRTTGVPFPFFDDEVPILMSNNHRKFPYTLTTRNKLTSDYANYWTTPSTTALYNDNSVFNKIPSKMPPNQRRRSTTTTTTTTTPSPQMLMGSKPPLKVSHVIASKNKEPDEVKSNVLTVLDPHGGSAHLPPNTSVVHRNVLVPFRPGRPKPVVTSTTQYPIYPILAGITNWPIQNNHSSTYNNNNNNNDNSNVNNNDHTNDNNGVNSWQWDDTDTYSGSTVSPSSFDPVTTSKSPIEYLDQIPVSTMHRPTIAVIGSKPGGFGSYRPTPTTVITSSPSTSSSSGSIPTPAQSFLISDYQQQQHHQNQLSTPSTTQHVISVTPIGSNTGHVLTSSVNTSTGQQQQQQHIFGEVIHSSRPPSASSAGHQSDVNLSAAAAAASSSLTTSGSSQSFIVTTTTTESSNPPKDTFIHAIYAPPMPSSLNKPSQVQLTNPNTLLALFGVDSFSGLFTQLTVFKALLFTALVILLPPLTVAAAFSTLAG